MLKDTDFATFTAPQTRGSQTEHGLSFSLLFPANKQNMSSSRFQRRPLLLSILIIASLYLAGSQLRKPGVDLSILPSWTSQSISPLRYASHLRDQVVLNAPVSSPAAAPGFERALPSCRVADLIDDPLVKEYGQNNIRLSRTYEGTGARVRQLLQKAMRGEKIKIAAVGGSVSTVSIPF